MDGILHSLMIINEFPFSDSSRPFVLYSREWKMPFFDCFQNFFFLECVSSRWTFKEGLLLIDLCKRRQGWQIYRFWGWETTLWVFIIAHLHSLQKYGLLGKSLRKRFLNDNKILHIFIILNLVIFKGIIIICVCVCDLIRELLFFLVIWLKIINN